MELDDEERQLLAEEEAFLASGQRPSARLQHGAKKSRFMQRREKTAPQAPVQESVVSRQVKVMPVMGSVVERATGVVSSPVAAFPAPGSQAFPVSGHRSQTGEKLGSGLGKEPVKKSQPPKPKKATPAVSVMKAPPADSEAVGRLAKRQLLDNATELEVEKMKWMKGGADDVEQGKKWRFTLEGLVADDVLAAGAGPYQPELHHHGEEPDRPGYTLDELLHLSRSVVPAQRAVALQTLAAVMRAAKRGLHGSRPVLLALFQKDIAVYCRAALDDSTVTALAAAVDCLHALVTNPRDPAEVFAGRVCYLQQERMRKLAMGTCKVLSLDEGEEGSHMEDANLARTNLLYVLVLRMNTVQRVRYIIDVLAPRMPAASLVQLLEISLRFCDHSPELSLATFGCPYFVEAVLKLISSSLAAGRVNACELGLQLIVSFVHGSAACARVLLASSDGGPSQLQQLLGQLFSASEQEVPRNAAHLAVTIASSLMEYTGVGLEHVCLHPSTFVVATSSLGSSEGVSLRLTIIALRKGEVLPQNVLGALLAMLDQMVAATAEVTQTSEPQEVYRLVNYWTCLCLCCAVELPSAQRDLITACCGPLLGRLVVQHLEMLAAFQEGMGGHVAPQHAALPQLPPCERFAVLDALGCICAELLPLASSSAQVKDLWELVHSQRSMETALEPSVALLGGHLVASSDRFHLKLFEAVTGGPDCDFLDDTKSLFFNRTLLALLWLHPGDEDLLRTMVGRLFEPSNITAVLSAIGGVGESQMGTLLSSARSLKNAFLICLCGADATASNAKASSLFLDAEGSTLPLRPHWMYLPLRIAFSESERLKTASLGDLENQVISSQAPFVTAGLLFILATVNNRSLTEEEKAFGALEILRVTLLPGQLYMEPTIHALLTELRERFSPAPGHSLTFAPLPDSGGLYNLLADAIEEYAASSFGDSLFTSFLLLFATMEQPLEFRKVIWRELCHMLRFLQPVEAIHEQEEAIRPYLYPLESDKEAISLMIAALRKGSLQEEQNPFLFNIAVHHIAAFCFDGLSGSTATYMNVWAAAQLLEGVPLTIRSAIATYTPPGASSPLGSDEIAIREATLGIS